MAAVEDGEILELDTDEVIALCTEGQPTALLVHQSRPDPSPPPVSHSIGSFARNPYRGGDPFLAPRKLHDGAHPAAGFSRLCRSSVQYRVTRSATGALSDMHSSLRPPVQLKEPIFERDPYATDSAALSVIQESAKTSSILTRRHSFPVSISSSDAHIISAPRLSPSPDSWPRSAAPPDASIRAFRGPSDSQMPSDLDYDHDPDRYSPRVDQPLFADRPVYHAEPGPQPSFYFGGQHPSVRPMNAGPRRSASDVEGRRRAPTSHWSQEASGTMFRREVYAGGVAEKQVFPANNAVSPATGFTKVGMSYQAIHAVQSPRHRLLETEVHEEENMRHRGPLQVVGLDKGARDRGRHSQQHMVSSRQRRLSEPLVTERRAHDEEDREKRRTDVEPRMYSLSDKGNQRTNPDDSRESPERRCDSRNTDQENGDSPSRPKSDEKKNENLPRRAQDNTSDGEVDSSRIASPVISLATVQDETPSPPSSTKKKPANFDAKKHLSELRKKALMSVKKRPAARLTGVSVEPTSPCANPSISISRSPGGVEGPQGVHSTQPGDLKNSDRQEYRAGSYDRNSNSGDESASGIKVQLDSTVQLTVGGVRKTMTRRQFAEWQAWPFQNRVVVDYSSDSSGSGSGGESDGSDCDADGFGKVSDKVRRTTYRNRESEIEAMKIRMIRLGKCPSILFGGSNSSNGIENWAPLDSIGKRDDKPEPSKDDKSTAKEGDLSQAKTESQPTIGTSREGQKDANLERISSPKQVDSLNLKVSNLSTAQEPSSSNLENRNDNVNAPLTGQQVSTLLLQEGRSSQQHLKISEHVSTSANGTVKGNAVQEDKDCAQVENQRREKQGEDGLAFLKSPRSSAGTNTANPIAELKRRIAAIEKSRDLLKQQQHKRQKTMATPEVLAAVRTRTEIEQKHLQQGTNGGTGRNKLRTSKQVEGAVGTVQGGNRGSRRGVNRGGKRYYSSGNSFTVQRKVVALSGQDRMDSDMDVDTELQESLLDTAGTKNPSTNERRDAETALLLPDDKAERRYIDDLKLELQQKTKELMNERDRTEQLRTAEMAVAEAQAKLNFTRSRVSALRDELQKAEQDVLDAERECRQRAKVVSQLCSAGTKISAEIASGQEEANGRVQVMEDVDISVLSTTLDTSTTSDREQDKRQEEEGVADLVLRPSPYSPSVGDNFTSCLRALRAYLLRIPHHSKARDRIAGGILSSTWGVDLDPMKAVCPQELRGQCSKRACEFQHLKVFKAPKDRALQVIHVIETFFSGVDKEKEEKSIVNARIAIHEGKDATKTLSSLISTLCASSKAIPFSCVTD